MTDEALLREVSARIDEAGEAMLAPGDEALLEFFCECGRTDAVDVVDDAGSAGELWRPRRSPLSRRPRLGESP